MCCVDDEVKADKVVAAVGRLGGAPATDDIETGADAADTDDPRESTLRYLRVVGDIGAVKLWPSGRQDSRVSGGPVPRAAKTTDSRVDALWPLALVDLPAFLHVAPDARFAAGRARLDDPLEFVDPPRQPVLVDREEARVGPEEDGDGRGGVFSEARALARLGAPFEDDVPEDFGEVRVFHDRRDGRVGSGGVDLVRPAKEAQDGREVDWQERGELRAEAGTGRDEFEGRAAEGAAFGDDLRV